MKKTLIITAIIMLSLSVFGLTYAQPMENPGITFSPINNALNNYDYRAMQPDNTRSSLFTSAFLNPEKNIVEQPYSNTPINKAGDGVINAATFWVDVPREMAANYDEDNKLGGYAYGFGMGIYTGFKRGVSGAVDMATLGMLPPEDKPLMQPAYKVDNPQQGLKITLVKW